MFLEGVHNAKPNKRVMLLSSGAVVKESSGDVVEILVKNNVVTMIQLGRSLSRTGGSRPISSGDKAPSVKNPA